MVDHPDTNLWNAGISVWDETETNRVYLVRAYSSSYGNYYAHIDVPGYTYTRDTGHDDLSGKLRLVRSGTTISSYYWNGSSWTLVKATSVSGYANDMSVLISASVGGSNPTVTVDFDNFTVISGTVIPELMLEDASLNLAAYYQKMEDLASFLRAHDGIEYRDLQTELAAFNLSEEDLSAWLAAYYESFDDLGASLETWATKYKDLGIDLDVKGQSMESLKSYLEAAKAEFKDLGSFLSVTDGNVLKDLGSFLSATDGEVFKDVGMHLKVVQSVPAFRSIIAQRVSSVIQEVS
jgi:hypothetical protein